MGSLRSAASYACGDLSSCTTSVATDASVRLPAATRARRKNSMDSQHAMVMRARQNGTMKYSIRNTKRPATNPSFGTCGSATSIAASNTPSEPGAWLAKPRSVADTKATAMVKNSPVPADGITAYMASDEQLRSATPMPICIRVDNPPGSTTLQYRMPNTRSLRDTNAT